MKSFDVKSLLAGAALAILALLAMGQRSMPQETGRYQGVPAHDGPGVYVVDTATGRVIRLEVRSVSGGPVDFETMVRVASPR